MILFDKLGKEPRRRSVVVGLDGVPYTLLQDLKTRGRIPNMSALFEKGAEQGALGRMSVCIPEISSVSWSSFMTGSQAGAHGIFGFMDLEQGTYKMYFPNFGHLKGPTLWDKLAQQGKKSVVINMPSTYPARRIDGALISGFVAIDLNKAVYPASLIPRLKGIGYQIDVDTMKARQNHEFLFKDLEITLESRRKAVDLLWREIDWDLFIVVITGTDRLMHFLWDAYERQDHPYHGAFLDYFQRVDQVVGAWYERFSALDGSKDGRNSFYMLSDHGFTAVKTEVYLNRWLQDNGYLKFKKQSPDTIMDIGEGSTAFAMDPSRIYVNLKGKYPLGTVDPADYDRIRSELKARLETLAFGDNAVAKKVYLREELYSGPAAGQGPDLVVLSRHGYDLKAKVKAAEVFGRSNLMGMHTQDDAFFFSSRGKPCSSIFEAADLILEGFGSANA